MSHFSNNLFYKACTKGDLDSIKHYITAEKCDVNTKNKFGCSPLCVSCQLGHTNITQFLLTIPECDVNFKTPLTGNTPLHIASLHGYEAIVQELLHSKKCDVNCKNKAGDTPLHMASHNGHDGIVQALLNSKECDVNCKNKAGDTPLHMASHNGHDGIVQALVNSKECDVNCKNKDQNGNTALHMAVQTNNSKCVALLLASTSCDPNVATSEGDTPLHIAARRNMASIVEMLLACHGVDPNAKNAGGETTLITACSSDCFECTQILTSFQECDLNKQNNAGNTALHVAVQHYNSQIITVLLCNSSCNPNIRGLDGDTPLHLSVKIINTKCVEALLANTSCDPNVVNSEGNTPLHIACQQGSVESIGLLLSTEKLNLSQLNSKGNTVLHLAIQAKSRMCVEKLLASTSCDPNIANNEGDTPLHIACQQGSIDIIQLLLGIDRIHLHAMNTHGKMPLHVANLQAIQYLVEQKCYIINEKDGKGNTVLHLSTKIMNTECVKALLASTFCDPNALNSEGDTPLHIACQQGSVEIIDLLLGSEKTDLHAANARGQTPLHIAFQTKNIWLIEKLSVNNIDELLVLSEEYGIGNMLHIACMYKYVELAKSILEWLCTVEAVNEPNLNGDTPLHVAANTNTSALLELLLACDGANPNAKNAKGDTVLIAACKNDCFECAKILTFFQGCDPNKQDNAGNSALHVAVQHNNCDLISILLSNSTCDPNISNLEGNTPLHLAVQARSSTSVAALLTSASCDPNILNGYTDTVLHIACQQGAIEIIDLLFSSEKLDMYVTNCEGIIPLHIVLQMMNIPLVIKLLVESCNPRYLNREQIFKEANDLALEYEIGSLFHIACQYGSSEIVNFFLGSTNCTVEAMNEPDVNGNSPLHLAAQANMSAIVEKLLAYHGIDPNAVNTDGITPLIAACNNECIECTQILVRFQGCDPNMQNEIDGSALHVAVHHNNCQLINILLSSSSCDPNISNLQGDTPLHLAVRTKSSKCVAALLASTSCDPNKRNSKGNTPLHIACQQGSVETIDLLLNSERLDFYIKNADGKLPLHATNVETLKYFMQSGHYSLSEQDNEGNTILHMAVRTKASEYVATLLTSASYDLNKGNSEGDTPLHIACQQGSIEIIDILLSSEKLDLYSANAHGTTPLQIVFQKKHFQLIVKLLEKSCKYLKREQILQEAMDLAQKYDIGSLLHLACTYGCTGIVELFLGSSYCTVEAVNEPDMSGNTPLHIATRKNMSAIVKMLLACHDVDPNVSNTGLASFQGCDSNQQDNAGNTSLHIAVKYNNCELISILLSNISCDPNISNLEGDTPLHLAVQSNSSQCVALLLSSTSCDLNKGNSGGDTPLHIACQQGSVEIIDLLMSFEKLDLSSANVQGTTPLQIVFQKKHFSLIVKLLEKICHRVQILKEAMDLAQKYDIGSLLHLACTYGCTGIIRLFLSSSYCTVEAVNEPDMNGNTPLHIATRINMSAIVKMLLACHDVDPNAKNIGGVTALIVACNNDGCFECVQILASSQRCDPNEQDNTGSTALRVAVRHNNCEVISILLSNSSCDPNISNIEGDIPLHLAVQNMSSKCVALLLACSSCDPNVLNCAGDTPLHIACRMGHVQIVKLFTETSHCNPNILNHRGEAPLHIAIESNLSFRFITNIELLLQTKVIINPNIVNAAGETPLYIACKLRKINVIEMLLKLEQCDPNVGTHQDMTPLHIAIGGTYMQEEIVQLLLANPKTDAHPINMETVTPLQFAFEKEHSGCFQYLLEKSTSPHYPNREQVIKDAVKLTSGNLLLAVCCWGNTTIAENLFNSDWYRSGIAIVKGILSGDTLFHVSIINDKPDMVRLLVKYDVDINMKNGRGETPLQTAYGLNIFTCVRILADYSTGGVDKDGNTILHNAVITANINMIKTLLCGTACNPNECNAQGETPLHVACRDRSLECVNLLLSDERCNVDIQNKTGDTALHIAIQEEQVSIVKYLIQDICCNPAIANADGNTPLHLACNKGAWNAHGSILMIVKLLLSTGRVDPECVDNTGRTPVELSGGNDQIVKELSSFVDTTLKHRIQSYIKLFFMGNANAGKSTLVQAILTEASKLRKLAPSSQFKQVTGVEPLTAGIVPLAFRSKHFGNAILYDFAGQQEYYSSHAAVLENLVLTFPPIFLLIFNLSESFDQIREELAYWWSFIDSHCKKTSVTPHVILIGSHKDILKSRRQNAKEILTKVVKSLEDVPATFHTAGHVSLDCRSLVSSGLSELLTLLKDTCKKLRESVDINIDLRCHILYAFLTDKFQHRVACTVSEVQAAILTYNTILPQNPTDLEKLLSTLSDMGHILFLRKSSESFEDCWIVLQRQTLLTEVHGSMFAPINFRQHIKDLAQVTGVVPLSKIKQRFQNSFNSPTPELVIVYSLTHLEFCFKIKDYHTLDLFASDSKAQVIDQENEEYYFFPALVQVETPTNVWKLNPQTTFQCGWFYECIHPYQFLTTRFLHVLILRLAFSFALAVDHTSSRECPVIRRQCSMWKHGIAWWNDDGIETIVEVGLQRHWVVAMMRCAEDQQMEFIQHRTAVIKSILGTKDEFCPSILMSESLISPSSIQYPCQKEGEKSLYSLKAVATTLVKGKPYVTHDIYDPIKLTELLPLEPYIGLSKEILEKLFSDEYLEKQVTDPDLIQIAEKAYHNLRLFEAAIKPNPLTWQRCCNQAGSNEVLLCVYLLQVFRDRGSKTFKDLQAQLSKFSIFCGRNPLVSTHKILKRFYMQENLFFMCSMLCVGIKNVKFMCIIILQDVAEGKCSAVQDTAHNFSSAHSKCYCYIKFTGVHTG